ncbi:MAG: hypothetical protein ACKON9_16590, partial [Planctomycetaceae bacterium]
VRSMSTFLATEQQTMHILHGQRGSVVQDAEGRCMGAPGTGTISPQNQRFRLASTGLKRRTCV